MNRDTVIGIIGAVVLIVAMVGVFQYERVRASKILGDGETTDPASLVTTAGPVVEGTTAYQGKSEETFTIETPGVRKVDLTVIWQAQNGQDTLKVHVVPPEGIEASGENPVESDSGRASLSFNVPDGANASGTWMLHVEFTRATGLQEVPGVGPVQGDTEVSWKAETKLSLPGDA